MESPPNYRVHRSGDYDGFGLPCLHRRPVTLVVRHRIKDHMPFLNLTALLLMLMCGVAFSAGGAEKPDSAPKAPGLYEIPSGGAITWDTVATPGEWAAIHLMFPDEKRTLSTKYKILGVVSGSLDLLVENQNGTTIDRYTIHLKQDADGSFYLLLHVLRDQRRPFKITPDKDVKGGFTIDLPDATGAAKDRP